MKLPQMMMTMYLNLLEPSRMLERSEYEVKSFEECKLDCLLLKLTKALNQFVLERFRLYLCRVLLGRDRFHSLTLLINALNIYMNAIIIFQAKLHEILILYFI